MQPLIRRAPRALASPSGWLTLGVGLLYLATYDSRIGSPDETHRFAEAVAIARHGLGALAGSGSVSRYPPLQSILAAPLVRLGIALDGGANGVWAHRLGVSVSLVAAVALVPLFYAVARRLEVPVRTAAVATALFGLTSPVWPYSKRFFSEPLTAALALGAFAGALAYVRTGRLRPLALGLVCLGLMPLNNYVTPIAVGLGLSVLFFVEDRRRAIIGVAAAGVVGGGLTVLLFAVRFGSALRAGYAGEGFTFHTLQGLHGLLFGWGRSIFLFAPLVVLSLVGLRRLWRRSRGAASGMLVALAAELLIVASWWCWWGGVCWGPRLVLPILPVASIGAAPLLERPGRVLAAAVIVVLASGLYVQTMGFSFGGDFDLYFWLAADNHDEHKAWFDWQYSVLRRMPEHFARQPWDLSSSYLSLVQTGPSTVTVGRRPVTQIRLVNEGNEIVWPWSVADIYVVLAGGRRVPAGALGAHLLTFDGRSGAGALDGNPQTRWTSRSRRRRGMWLTLVLPKVRHDVVRLDVVHMPWARQFPDGLSASIRMGPGPWTPVPAHAATPRIHFDPLIYLFAGGGVLALLVGLWLARRGSRSPGSELGAMVGGERGEDVADPPEGAAGPDPQPRRHDEPEHRTPELAVVDLADAGNHRGERRGDAWVLPGRLVRHVSIRC